MEAAFDKLKSKTLFSISRVIEAVRVRAQLM
jgi:hypothetical protein